MQPLNTKISILSYITGMLFLAGALIAIIYSPTDFFGVKYPYHDFAVPLLIIGIVLLFIGYVTEPHTKEEK